MAITNPTPLPAAAFSLNPIWLILNSDNYIATPGVAAVNYIEFRGAVNAGDQLQLAWGTTAQTMTAEAAPDDSGVEFPAGAGDQAYVTAIEPYFANSYLINRDFTVTTDFTGQYPRLVFTAINVGAAYSFTPGSTGNSYLAVTTAGADEVWQSNFAHHQEIWMKRAADAAYSKVWDYNIELDVPETGSSTVDISQMLHNYLLNDTPVFVANPAITACLRSVAQYYIKYGQYYGQTPTVKTVKQTRPAMVVLGGLGKAAALSRNITSELCPDANDSSKNRFMRQGSKTKIVTKEQPEWLYFFNPDSTIRSVNIEVTIVYSQGDPYTYNVIAGYQLQAWQKIQFPAGFNQLSIAAQQAGRVPVYYTIRLKWGNMYFTDIYSFILDNNYREWPRYFVYRNAYGAYQTIGTIGERQTDFDRTKTDGHLSKNPNVVPIDGDFMEYNLYIQEKGTVNIGYQRSNKRNELLLRDFMSSESKFIYENGQLIPIGLTTTNLKDAQDGTNVYANSFEYFYLYQDQVFTEEPGQPDDDLNTLLAIAGSALIGSNNGGTNTGTNTDNVIKIKNTTPGYAAANGMITVSDARLTNISDVIVESTQVNQILPDSEFTLNNPTPGVLTVQHQPLLDGEYLSIFLIP